MSVFQNEPISGMPTHQAPTLDSNAVISHSLMAGTVASHVFQAYHLNLNPLKHVPKPNNPNSNAAADGETSNDMNQMNAAHFQHEIHQVVHATSEVYSQIKKQHASISNSVVAQHVSLGGATTSGGLLLHQDDEQHDMIEFLDQNQQHQHHVAPSDPHETPEISEFLLKYSTTLQLQQAETEMMDWLLECYLKELRDTLALSDAPATGHNVFSVSPTQQQQTVSPTAVPSQQQLQQQLQQHQQQLVLQGSTLVPASKPSPSPVNAAPQAAFGQKKPEEVISELKKKYSGQVLQVAQSKKKKKNFGKDATDYLNMWFFNHLHDPYPTDEEKKVLAQQTNLNLSQVNNWFGNKRMRYKRKMLEQNRKQGGGGQAGDDDDSPSPTSSPVPPNYQNAPPQQAYTFQNQNMF